METRNIKMTAKAALVKHLLDGHVLNVRNVFMTIGYTNASREISRMVEQCFDVKVTRSPREGKSRYGQPVVWVDYHLERNARNAAGIAKMKQYLAEHFKFPVTNAKYSEQSLFQ